MPPRLSDLPPSLQKTFILAYLYLESKRQSCLTYRGLRAWMYYNHEVRQRLGAEWHTVERGLRKLAEMEVFRRIYDRGRRKVVFCKGRYYSDFVVEYNTRLRAHQAENPLELLARG